MRESVLIVPYNSVLSFSLGLWPGSPTQALVHLHRAPKTMRRCCASSQGHCGLSPGAGVFSDKSMPDLLSQLNRSFVVLHANVSVAALRFHRFPPLGIPCVASSIGTRTVLDTPPPPLRPSQSLQRPAIVLLSKRKRTPARSHVEY